MQALAESLGDEWCATHPEMAATICYRPDLNAIEHAKASCTLIGGRRVNLISWTAEKDPEDKKYGDEEPESKKDNSVRDYRDSQIREAHDRVPPTSGICQHCGKGFEKDRKGTKHCSDHCRKMHWKEKGQAKNLPTTIG